MTIARHALVLLAAAAWTGEAPLLVLEPAASAPAVARKPEPARWSWNQAMAEISPSGDLAWKPEAFRYQPGASVRHIDFAQGDDGNDGSRAKPWKHHPWDAAATGNAKAGAGSHTYVFKRGVAYRGQLRPTGGGTAAEPIRLTSDPAWGEGEATILGTETVAGWKHGETPAGMPDSGKVWQADVAYLPRNLWVAGTDGAWTRIPLARMPNWTVSDPEDVMSEWWTWEQPEWWTGKWQIDWKGTTFGAKRAHLGIDTKHLTGTADDYVGAIVRTEYGIVMGTPFPTKVEGFDAARKGVIFQGIWTGDSEKILTRNRYYLEDKANFLDSAGEFWVERMGDGGRIFLRLPGDADPSTARIEAGRHTSLIEATDLSHVAISGLTFRGGNTPWELWQPAWGHPEVANAAVRVLGSSEGLRVANCRFEHLPGRALRIDAAKPEQRFADLAFTDNDIRFLDQGILEVKAGGRGDVQVLRNRAFMTGMRPHRQMHGHGIIIEFPETMQVAGNVLDRTYGAGIFVFGGKGSGDRRDVPLSRSLIHGNRVVDSLLAANDWGGIETWQCGPHYVFNNISGNANGYWNWGYNKDRPGSARLGFNYYFDGSFKNWVFNNVAWGRSSDPASQQCSHAAFYQAVQTIHNSFFNNTAHSFHIGSNWSPAGGRSLFLGNLFADISGPVFQHGKLKEDKGKDPARYPYDSIGFARNLFAGCTGKVFGHFEADGTPYADAAGMAAALAKRQTLASDLGTQVAGIPLPGAAKQDFRPAKGSPGADGGVKVYVPWALARTVGEWQFRRNQADPTVALDDSWYPSAYHAKREEYHRSPVWNLRGEGITAASYEAGPLEDWAAGALHLDGKARLVLAQTAMSAVYEFDTDKQGRQQAEGAQLNSPDGTTGNLIIETWLKAEAGQSAAALVRKLDGGTGYQLALNKAGGVSFAVSAGGVRGEVASGARIADGAWHHVLAELDRAAGTVRVYTDGVKSAEAPMGIGGDASLASAADLVVGEGFRGTLEFLRIARSSLAESRTSIEELYDWQVDGPFLRDFAGRKPLGMGRDAGAFEIE